MEKIEKLEQLIRDARDDADKFYNKENKAAGTRLRKHMQELKNIAQEVRNEVTEKKNG
ncbi:histone H1 [Cesiribacter sp. SM1]|jgi:vacuolar-type H+-ATPase subunit H|uniref:histone H1 n=1 Tax=Cesiribacter sp. SM1 TaxID=2861196 RepID=UPI001CD596E0|nr:histone H1 [Cesiribacter sp. SM1]